MALYFETQRLNLKKLILVFQTIVAALGSNEFRTLIESIKNFIRFFKKKGD